MHSARRKLILLRHPSVGMHAANGGSLRDFCQKGLLEKYTGNFRDVLIFVAVRQF